MHYRNQCNQCLSCCLDWIEERRELVCFENVNRFSSNWSASSIKESMNNPLKLHVFYTVRLYGTKTEQVKAIWISFELWDAALSYHPPPDINYIKQLLVYLSVNAFFPYPSRRLFTVVVSLISCKALVWKLPVQWAHIILVLVIGSESFESESPLADPNSSGEVGHFLTCGCIEQFHNILFI